MDRILIGNVSEVLVGEWPQPLLPPRAERRRAAVLTQPGAAETAAEVVSRLAAEGVEAHLVVLPDRDQAKSLEVVGTVYDHLTEWGLARYDTVVGVGGGAITDLAGFVAATWLRGVEAVLVPTTLLAAVDAAVGGKTGINWRGKNLVGAFWHPRRVVINLPVLEGLPSHLLVEGSAEALKAGLIGDPGLVSVYEEWGQQAPLAEVVPRAVAVKARVVSEDFRESGLRAVLNYGHTVGHAVETATGMPHGEAVAVGMVAAGAVSQRRYGFDAEWQRRLVASLGLPVSSPPLDRELVWELLGRDKKRDQGGIRMVLLRGVADPVVERVVPAEVEEALAAVGL